MDNIDPFETPFTAMQYYAKEYYAAYDEFCRITLSNEDGNCPDYIRESVKFYSKMYNMAIRLWEDSVDNNIRTYGLVMSGYPAAWYGEEKGWDWWPKGSHGDEPFVFI